MKRRRFIALLSSAAVIWSASAQYAKLLFVGLLSGTRLDDVELGAVRLGLKESGYLEGRNLAIEHRSADGHYDRLGSIARELVQQEVDVIIAIGGTVTVLAAKNATSSIPIVFATAGDPVKLGLVAALNRPGGNITGVTFLASGLAAKRLEMLRELVPKATMIGFLVNPANPNLESETKELQVAARIFGQQIYIQRARNENEIDMAFGNFAEQRMNALVVAADAMFTSRREQVVALAARHSIPAIYALREFVVVGGLTSYGVNRVEAFRLVGDIASRILKGTKPADLPVQQSQKIELVVNLKTAKALGLKPSREYVARVDEVIE